MLHILPDQFAWASGAIGRPVLDGGEFFVVIHAAQQFQAVHNELPGAVDIFADFAFTVGGAPAGAVHDAFGATGNGADAAGLGQNTLAAGLATFHVDPEFFDRPQEGRVEARVDGLGVFL